MDTVRTCDLVEIEVMSDGSTCLCYRDSITGVLFFAQKSDTWRRETLGPAASASAVNRHLVVGPGGRPAILLTNSPIAYLVDTDAGWSSTTLGWGAVRAFLAFDHSGHASVLWATGTGNYSLFSAMDQDSAWFCDTLWLAPDLHQYPRPHVLSGICSYVVDRWGRFNTMTRLTREWGGDPFHHLGITSGWTRNWTGQEILDNSHIAEYALAPRSSDGVMACYAAGVWSQFWYLYCDSAIVDSGRPSSVSLRNDTRGQPQMVYRLDVLKYARRTDAWHNEALPEGLDRASHFDLAVDDSCRPIIALAYNSGIFIAKGDPLAVAEDERANPPVEAKSILAPSLSRAPVRFRLSDPVGTLVIRDPLGRLICRLPARGNVTWDGRDYTGRTVSAGLYFAHTVSASRDQRRPTRFVLLD